MKENKKKAFTIIELLIAIAIIGILAIVAVPAVGKYIENGRQSYYESLGKELIVMARDYYTQNVEELPRGQQTQSGARIYYKILTLEEIEKANYVTNEVVDTNKNSCEESYVTIKNNRTGNYEYQACLICNGITRYGNEEECIFGGLRDNDIPECEIAVKDYPMGTWTNKDVTLTITGYDKTGVGKVETIGEPLIFPKVYVTDEIGRKVSTSTIAIGKKSRTGIVEVNVYDVAGNGGYCKTEQEILIDKDKPICESITIDNQEWAKEKTITVVANDALSGLATISINGTILEGNPATHKITKNGIYTATITDVAGNNTTCSITESKTDGEDPVVTIANGTGKESVVITGTLKDDVGIVKYQWTTINEEPTNWIEIQSTTKIKLPKTVSEAGTYYLWAKDAMDNLGVAKTIVTATRCCDSCQDCTTTTKCSYREVCDSYPCGCSTYYTGCRCPYTLSGCGSGYIFRGINVCYRPGYGYMGHCCTGSYRSCSTTCYKNCRNEAYDCYDERNCSSPYECRCGTCFK